MHTKKFSLMGTLTAAAMLAAASVLLAMAPVPDSLLGHLDGDAVGDSSMFVMASEKKRGKKGDGDEEKEKEKERPAKGDEPKRAGRRSTFSGALSNAVGHACPRWTKGEKPTTVGGPPSEAFVLPAELDWEAINANLQELTKQFEWISSGDGQGFTSGFTTEGLFRCDGPKTFVSKALSNIGSARSEPWMKLFLENGVESVQGKAIALAHVWKKFVGAVVAKHGLLESVASDRTVIGRELGPAGQEDLSRFLRYLSTLDQGRRFFIRNVFVFVNRVVAHQGQNKIDAPNVAMLLGPVLFPSPTEFDLRGELADTAERQRLVLAFLNVLDDGALRALAHGASAIPTDAVTATTSSSTLRRARSDEKLERIQPKGADRSGTLRKRLSVNFGRNKKADDGIDRAEKDGKPSGEKEKGVDGATKEKSKKAHGRSASLRLKKENKLPKRGDD